MDDVIIHSAIAYLRAVADTLESLLPQRDDIVHVLDKGRSLVVEGYRQQLKSLGLNTNSAEKRLNLALQGAINQYEINKGDFRSANHLHWVLYTDRSLWTEQKLLWFNNVGEGTMREVLRSITPVNYSKII